MQRIRVVTAAILAGMLMLALPSGVAQAHARTFVASGGEYGAGCDPWWAGCYEMGRYGWSKTHRTAKVCDTRIAYAAWLKWKRKDGSTGIVKDRDGAGGKCYRNYDRSRLIWVQYCSYDNGDLRCLKRKYTGTT